MTLAREVQWGSRKSTLLTSLKLSHPSNKGCLTSGYNRKFETPKFILFSHGLNMALCWPMTGQNLSDYLSLKQGLFMGRQVLLRVLAATTTTIRAWREEFLMLFGKISAKKCGDWWEVTRGQILIKLGGFFHLSLWRMMECSLHFISLF